MKNYKTIRDLFLICALKFKLEYCSIVETIWLLNGTGSINICEHH